MPNHTHSFRHYFAAALVEKGLTPGSTVPYFVAPSYDFFPNDGQKYALGLLILPKAY